VLADVEHLRERGKTVLLISHRPEEVRQLADRIVTLEAGKVVEIEHTGRHAPERPLLHVIRDSESESRSREVRP